MTRHESRDRAFCLLFEYSFGGEPETIIENAKLYREETVSDFADKLFRGTVENISDIDSYIGGAAENRAFTRIGRVPLAAMRLAAYEITCTDTPTEIIINEALELCREYNCNDSVSYVNGVLAKIVTYSRRNEAAAETAAEEEING